MNSRAIAIPTLILMILMVVIIIIVGLFIYSKGQGALEGGDIAKAMLGAF